MMYGQQFYGPGMQPQDAQPAPWANVFDMLRSQYAAMAAQGQPQQPQMPVVHYRAGMGGVQSAAAGAASRISIPMGFGAGQPSQPAQPGDSGGDAPGAVKPDAALGSQGTTKVAKP